MKKNIFFLATLFITILFVGCANKQSQPKLEDLSSEDISKITILALEVGKMIEVTNVKQIETILSTIHELSLYAKSNQKNDYNNQLIQYTLHITTGDSLTIELQDSWIGYNNTWFLCDQSIYKSLSDMAFRYLP